MFKVFPVQTTKERKDLCARLGADFLPDDMAYRVLIEEEEAGIVTFSIKGKKALLRQIRFYPEKEDFEVALIAGRVAMNFMDSVGANEGYFLCPSAEQQKRLAIALGYKKQPDGSWYLDTTGFFVEHCKNHPEENAT